MSLALQQVSKQFGSVTALDRLSFSVAQGEAVAFLGPNGAGKTTAMRLLTGWLNPDAGDVWVADRPVRRGHPPAALGYLPEHNPLRSERTVLETLLFDAQLLGLANQAAQAAVAKVVARCRLVDFFDRPCGLLSKGMRQRVGLARALLGEPTVLILDEPTTGLDPVQSLEIEALLRELRGSVTLLLSTHRLHRLPHWCDRAVMIRGGQKVYDGDPGHFLQPSREPEQVFAELVDGAVL